MDSHFKQHVARFLVVMPKYQFRNKQLMGITPELDAAQREVLGRHDLMPKDLEDCLKGL